MSSHAIYDPRRASSPAIFLQTPLRMRHPAPRRSFDVRWWSQDVARRDNLLSKEAPEVDGRRRKLTRAYLIEATLKGVKTDRPVGRMSVDTVVMGGDVVGKNKARHSSDSVKLAMTEVGGERRRSNRSTDRTTRLSKQMSNRSSTSRHPTLLRMKFKLVGKLIIICYKMADEHKFGNQRYEDLFPYVRTLHFHDYDDSDSYSNVVTFNPNKYKANKQLRIPEEARRILSKPPHERTETELLFAKTALLSLKSYAEYPVRMQMKIVAAGMYERYESKRMILRQGHTPTSFYFILSGSVVIMVQEADFPESIPIGYRGKGDTFGELAMIGKSRQSSIISKETIELLSLNVEDFEDIFMFGGMKNLTDPDHFDFLRSLDMLKDWPIERIINRTSSNEAVFMYFARGEVLVKDSHFLETLVIVKSGSVRVLKKMNQESKKAIETSWTGSKVDNQFDDEHLLPPLKREEERNALTELRVPKRLDNPDDNRLELPEITNVPAAAVHRHSLHVVLGGIGSDAVGANNQNYVRRLADGRKKQKSTGPPHGGGGDDRQKEDRRHRRRTRYYGE